jgi:hypothetical protein
MPFEPPLAGMTASTSIFFPLLSSQTANPYPCGFRSLVIGLVEAVIKSSDVICPVQQIEKPIPDQPELRGGAATFAFKRLRCGATCRTNDHRKSQAFQEGGERTRREKVKMGLQVQRGLKCFFVVARDFNKNAAVVPQPMDGFLQGVSEAWKVFYDMGQA